MDHTSFSQSCALCGVKRKLEQSHIIPQFVYRRAQATADKNNIPDGPTRRLLCGRCEDLFSFYESEFARHVFHPLAANPTLAVKYGSWLRKFAASVCWRILGESRAKNTPGHFSERWAPALVSCRETWRHYLTGKRPDVGGHHLHLLPWNAVLGEEGAGSGAVPGEQGPALRPVPSLGLTGVAAPRASQHSINMDVFCGDHAALVYAKLGPIILIGLIADPAPQQWRGTRINAEGKLKPRDVLVPDQCRDYIMARAQPH